MRKLAALLLLLTTCCAQLALADVVVVMRAGSSNDQLGREEVTNIFMGRYRKLPSGQSALPVDQPLSSPLRAQFYMQLVGKDLAEINAYWSRLYFSGKASPPIQTNSQAEVYELLLSQPGAIGYVDRHHVDTRMRVVYDPVQ